MALDFEKLFEQFTKHRKYVNNYSENTIKTYRWAWKLWRELLATSEITKPLSIEFIVRMREKGISPASCNVYLKAMNGFFMWLAEFEYIEPFKIKHLKAPQKIIEPLLDETVKKLVQWKPKKYTEHRLHTLVCLLLDSGLRINEALTLRLEDIDWDNLLIRVDGKGNKQRLVPFSVECRKILYRFTSKKHSFDIVFPTHQGDLCSYRNTWRDLQNLFDRLCIPRAGLHAFRHTFARNYLRQGGNLFYLSRAMGHTNLSVTRRYVKIETEDLQREQHRTSILNRIR
ncbi:MAG TPA: tyrosine-type recombinase/integrase [Pyrinomonadaceae bacterium]|jgi:integrase/recombinase XerD